MDVQRSRPEDWYRLSTEIIRAANLLQTAPEERPQEVIQQVFERNEVMPTLPRTNFQRPIFFGGLQPSPAAAVGAPPAPPAQPFDPSHQQQQKSPEASVTPPPPQAGQAGQLQASQIGFCSSDSFKAATTSVGSVASTIAAETASWHMCQEKDTVHAYQPPI
eukprot:TRINITY_DN10520_c0_g1_i2.p1 TRINITY_DN10520_c0_g1~~TRINITY_DN10520_c0_g1_i2.p1  ORF type:complete len:162 (+),score=45.01 TRINITY_DN10520_c0_g1_i2:232-717(+)